MDQHQSPLEQNNIAFEGRDLLFQMIKEKFIPQLVLVNGAYSVIGISYDQVIRSIVEESISHQTLLDQVQGHVRFELNLGWDQNKGNNMIGFWYANIPNYKRCKLIKKFDYIFGDRIQNIVLIKVAGCLRNRATQEVILTGNQQYFDKNILLLTDDQKEKDQIIVSLLNGNIIVIRDQADANYIYDQCQNDDVWEAVRHDFQHNIFVLVDFKDSYRNAQQQTVWIEANQLTIQPQNSNPVDKFDQTLRGISPVIFALRQPYNGQELLDVLNLDQFGIGWGEQFRDKNNIEYNQAMLQNLASYFYLDTLNFEEVLQLLNRKFCCLGFLGKSYQKKYKTKYYYLPRYALVKFKSQSIQPLTLNKTQLSRLRLLYLKGNQSIGKTQFKQLICNIFRGNLLVEETFDHGDFDPNADCIFSDDSNVNSVGAQSNHHAQISFFNLIKQIMNQQAQFAVKNKSNIVQNPDLVAVFIMMCNASLATMIPQCVKEIQQRHDLKNYLRCKFVTDEEKQDVIAKLGRLFRDEQGFNLSYSILTHVQDIDVGLKKNRFQKLYDHREEHPKVSENRQMVYDKLIFTVFSNKKFRLDEKQMYLKNDLNPDLAIIPRCDYDYDYMKFDIMKDQNEQYIDHIEQKDIQTGRRIAFSKREIKKIEDIKDREYTTEEIIRLNHFQDNIRTQKYVLQQSKVELDRAKQYSFVEYQKDYKKAPLVLALHDDKTFNNNFPNRGNKNDTPYQPLPQDNKYVRFEGNQSQNHPDFQGQRNIQRQDQQPPIRQQRLNQRQQSRFQQQQQNQRYQLPSQQQQQNQGQQLPCQQQQQNQRQQLPSQQQQQNQNGQPRNLTQLLNLQQQQQSQPLIQQPVNYYRQFTQLAQQPVRQPQQNQRSFPNSNNGSIHLGSNQTGQGTGNRGLSMYQDRITEEQRRGQRRQNDFFNTQDKLHQQVRQRQQNNSAQLSQRSFERTGRQQRNIQQQRVTQPQSVDLQNFNFICSLCPRTYDTKIAYLNHLETHDT